MLSWEHCVSIKEYILFGIRAYATSYAATGLIMVLLGAMGYLNWGKFVSYANFERRELIKPVAVYVSSSNDLT